MASWHAVTTVRRKRRAGEITTPTYLSLRQVAVSLGVHYDTVRRWIYAGTLQAEPLGAGPRPRLRVSLDALNTFLQRTSRWAGKVTP